MAPLAAHQVFRRALVAALLLLAVPGAADAAVSVERGKVTYTAGPEANHVVVVASGSTVQLTDTAPFTAGKGCSAAGSTVTCTKVSSVRVEAGDGDNFVDTRAAALPTTVVSGAGADEIYTGSLADSISSGGGADRIDAGAGIDGYSAGSGDDIVIARDGSFDAIGCGTGNDTGTDDDGDHTAPDCEALGDSLPAGGGTPPAEPGPAGGSDDPTDPLADDPGADPTDPGADPTDPPVGNPLTGPLNLEPPVVLAQSAPVTNGVAAIAIACPLDAGGCKGSVELFLLKQRGGLSAAVASNKLRIGLARFKAKAGAKLKVRVRLDRRGRRRVIRRRKLTVRAVVTTRTATGQVVKTAHRITLRRS